MFTAGQAPPPNISTRTYAVARVSKYEQTLFLMFEHEQTLTRILIFFIPMVLKLNVYQAHSVKYFITLTFCVICFSTSSYKLPTAKIKDYINNSASTASTISKVWLK